MALILPCREALQIYHNEIDTLHAKLEEDTKTKAVVQSGYEELTATVEAKTTAHKEIIANLQTRTTEGRRKSVEMNFKVSCILQSNRLLHAHAFNSGPPL